MVFTILFPTFQVPANVCAGSFLPASPPPSLSQIGPGHYVIQQKLIEHLLRTEALI